ncbi:hypothetical protein HDU76_001955 [Blyttiomyces sp. JEL0837]|nr:hypothetical protein HDU76_001955 [Blyttiomyces sp. JEL0837]
MIAPAQDEQQQQKAAPPTSTSSPDATSTGTVEAANATTTTSSSSPQPPASSSGIPKLKDVLGGDADTYTLMLPGDNLTADLFLPRQPQPNATSSSHRSRLVKNPSDPTVDMHIRSGRQVRRAAYSHVRPEPLPNPVLIGFSRSTAESVLHIDPDDPDLFPILTGACLPKQARSWAANYGGHQFGFYAGQLGDGRAVSLGEIIVPVPTATGASGSLDKPAAGLSIKKKTHQESTELPPRQELQLKGAGRTPYSRFGDGYAVLRSSLREFLASEYMAALGVPTTRALSIVGSNKAVYRENGMESGAMVARVAPSWVRFGTFELFWYRGEKEFIKVLADYVIKTHFQFLEKKDDDYDFHPQHSQPPIASRRPSVNTKPSTTTAAATPSINEPTSETGDGLKASWKGVLTVPGESDSNNNSLKSGDDHDGRRISVTTRPSLVVKEERTQNGEVKSVVVEPYAAAKQVDVELNKYARLFKEIVKRSATTCAHWQAVGFVHGVLNTDNMSILGLTMDYGPFMFLDIYDPWASSNHSDEVGRYRFEHQPKMVLWNLSKLGRTFVELVVMNEETGEPLVDGYGNALDGRDIIRQLLETFEPLFIDKYTELMRKKLGFRMVKAGDLENIILPLLWIMADVGADYNIFFRELCNLKLSDELFQEELGGKLVDPPPNVVLPESYINVEREEERRRTNMAASAMTLGKHGGGGKGLRATLGGGNSLAGAKSAGGSSVSLSANKKKKGGAASTVEVQPAPVGFPSNCLNILLKSADRLRVEAEEEMSSFRIKVPELKAGETSDPQTMLAMAAAAAGVALGIGSVGEDASGEEGGHDDVRRRRSIRPTDGYLSLKPVNKNPEDTEEQGVRKSRTSVTSAQGDKSEEGDQPKKDGEEGGGDNEDDDDSDADGSDSDEDDPLSDDLFGPWLPSEQEVRFRWQRWAKQYRSRLLLEQAASKSQSHMELEDQRRQQRMRKVNPRFSLRGWILEDLIERVSAHEEVHPVDPDYLEMKERLKEVSEAKKERMEKIGLKKDGVTFAGMNTHADTDFSNTPTTPQAATKPVKTAESLMRGGPSGLLPAESDELDDIPRLPLPLFGFEEVEQVMRVIIGDVWGDVMDTPPGFADFHDAIQADMWTGTVPKAKQNLMLSCSS